MNYLDNLVEDEEDREVESGVYMKQVRTVIIIED